MRTINKDITNDLNPLKKSLLIKENKNPSFNLYYHITNLRIWSYIDGELVLTPFDKEVSNVEKNYNWNQQSFR